MGCWINGKLYSPRDRPLIRSMAICLTHCQDSFCWTYTKNEQYTVNSGHWVAHNISRYEEETEVLEPSITELQAFAWKIKVP